MKKFNSQTACNNFILVNLAPWIRAAKGKVLILEANEAINYSINGVFKPINGSSSKCNAKG